MQCNRALSQPVKCFVVVAHPDDEIIWMGGTILKHPDWEWYTLALCRADDPDRAPRFRHAARELRARPRISDLDDSPVLADLSADLHEIKDRIRAHGMQEYDLIFTHGPNGEYSRHPRHEQVSQAVREMVDAGELRGDLLMFAYEDGGGAYRPRPLADAEVVIRLTNDELSIKRRIISEIYGFFAGSFEFDSAGSVEGFLVHKDGPTIQYLQDMLSSAHSACV